MSKKTLTKSLLYIVALTMLLMCVTIPSFAAAGVAPARVAYPDDVGKYAPGEIPVDGIVIGSYGFTDGTGGSGFVFDGLIGAASTIVDDEKVIVYYRGEDEGPDQVWLNGLTGEVVSPPEFFQLTHWDNGEISGAPKATTSGSKGDPDAIALGELVNISGLDNAKIYPGATAVLLQTANGKYDANKAATVTFGGETTDKVVVTAYEGKILLAKVADNALKGRYTVSYTDLGSTKTAFIDVEELAEAGEAVTIDESALTEGTYFYESRWLIATDEFVGPTATLKLTNGWVLDKKFVSDAAIAADDIGKSTITILDIDELPALGTAIKVVNGSLVAYIGIEKGTKESFFLKAATRYTGTGHVAVSGNITGVPGSDDADFDVYYVGASGSVALTFGGSDTSGITYSEDDDVYVSIPANNIVPIPATNHAKLYFKNGDGEKIVVRFYQVARTVVNVGEGGKVNVEFTKVANPTGVTGNVDVAGGTERSWILDFEDVVTYTVEPEAGNGVKSFKVDGNETALTNGKYRFTFLASEQHVITVQFAEAGESVGPYTINFETEKTGESIPTTVEWNNESASLATAWTTHGAAAAITLDAGKTYYFRTKADGAIIAGAVYSLTVPARPDAPVRDTGDGGDFTIEAGTDPGTTNIAGDETLEYKLNSGNWVDMTAAGLDVDVAKGDVVSVRVKAILAGDPEDLVYASLATEVTLAAGDINAPPKDDLEVVISSGTLSGGDTQQWTTAAYLEAIKTYKWILWEADGINTWNVALKINGTKVGMGNGGGENKYLTLIKGIHASPSGQVYMGLDLTTLPAGTLDTVTNFGISDSSIIGTGLKQVWFTDVAPTSLDVATRYPSTLQAAGITGLVAPIAGVARGAVGSLTATDTSKYSVTSMTWTYDVSGVDTAFEGNFSTDKVYKATIVLTAKDGYKFKALTPTVNTGTVAVGTVDGDDDEKTLTFAVTFPRTSLTEKPVANSIAPITGQSDPVAVDDVLEAGTVSYVAGTPTTPTLNYRWLTLGNGIGDTWTAIVDATSSTFKLTAAERGKSIKVEVTASGSAEGKVESAAIYLNNVDSDPLTFDAANKVNDSDAINYRQVKDTAFIKSVPNYKYMVVEVSGSPVFNSAPGVQMIMNISGWSWTTDIRGTRISGTDYYWVANSTFTFPRTAYNSANQYNDFGIQYIGNADTVPPVLWKQVYLTDVLPPAHEHTWANGDNSFDGWVYLSTTQHRRVCTDTDATVELGAHVDLLGGGDLEDEPDGNCDICGSNLNVDPCEEPNAHVAALAYSKNTTGHWYMCTRCNKAITETDIPGVTKVISLYGTADTYAAHESDAAAACGVAETCKDCGYEIAPALSHNYVWDDQVGDGTHTVVCSLCGDSKSETCSPNTPGSTCATCGYITPKVYKKTVALSSILENWGTWGYGNNNGAEPVIIDFKNVAASFPGFDNAADTKKITGVKYTFPETIIATGLINEVSKAGAADLFITAGTAADTKKLTAGIRDAATCTGTMNIDKAWYDEATLKLYFKGWDITNVTGNVTIELVFDPLAEAQDAKKAELNAAIDRLVSSDYSVAGWSAFQAALGLIETDIEAETDPEDVLAIDITVALQAAMQALELTIESPAAKITALQGTIELLRTSKVASDYTNWNAFDTAVTAAKNAVGELTLISAVDNYSIEALQNYALVVDSAALASAKADFNDATTGAIDVYVFETLALEETNYTPNSWTAFIAIVNEEKGKVAAMTLPSQLSSYDDYEGVIDAAVVSTLVSSGGTDAPTTNNATYTKTNVEEPSIEFTIANASTYSDVAPATVWKVYTDSSKTQDVTGTVVPTFSNTTGKLTLTQTTDVTAGTYYVTAQNNGKTESPALTLTIVQPKSATPAVEAAAVAKTALTQATVDFELSDETLTGTWVVYDSAVATDSSTRAEADDSTGTLTLTGLVDSDVPVGDYWVAVTETGKTVSDRLKLTVSAPTWTVTFNYDDAGLDVALTESGIANNGTVAAMPAWNEGKWVKDGKMIVGWNTTAGQTTANFTASTQVDGDTLVYPVWADVVKVNFKVDTTAIVRGSGVFEWGTALHLMNGVSDMYDISTGAKIAKTSGGDAGAVVGDISTTNIIEKSYYVLKSDMKSGYLKFRDASWGYQQEKTGVDFAPFANYSEIDVNITLTNDAVTVTITDPSIPVDPDEPGDTLEDILGDDLGDVTPVAIGATDLEDAGVMVETVTTGSVLVLTGTDGGNIMGAVAVDMTLAVSFYVAENDPAPVLKLVGTNGTFGIAEGIPGDVKKIKTVDFGDAKYDLYVATFTIGEEDMDDVITTLEIVITKDGDDDYETSIHFADVAVYETPVEPTEPEEQLLASYTMTLQTPVTLSGGKKDLFSVKNGLTALQQANISKLSCVELKGTNNDYDGGKLGYNTTSSGDYAHSENQGNAVGAKFYLSSAPYDVVQFDTWWGTTAEITGYILYFDLDGNSEKVADAKELVVASKEIELADFADANQSAKTGAVKAYIESLVEETDFATGGGTVSVSWDNNGSRYDIFLVLGNAGRSLSFAAADVDFVEPLE